MKIAKYYGLFLLVPIAAFAQTPTNVDVDVDANALLGQLLSIHPSLPAIAVIIWGAMKIADTFISEGKKSAWPKLARTIWDWSLLHVGQSRNAGSADAKSK